MRVTIMCKAPVAGRVKTRLMPPYTASQAADLHAMMAETVVRRACRLFADVVIAADDTAHPFFSRFDVPVVPQGEGDLGERMERLSRLWFAGNCSPLMFLGTDSPHMPDARLLAADDLLRSHDCVFGPVEDGGYDLLAINRHVPELLAEIDWGTGRVLRQSLAKATELELSIGQLDVSFDVDRADDIGRSIGAGWQPDPPISLLKK